MKLCRRTFWHLAAGAVVLAAASRVAGRRKLRNAILLATWLAALAPGAALAQVGKHLDGCFVNGHQVPCDSDGNDGGYSCDPGYHLTPSGSCLPDGYSVDCGSYSCKSGETCGSRSTCLSPGYKDCGNGTSCSAGDRCGSHGGCVPAGASECGDGGYCGAGQKCTSDNKCVTADPLAECGDGSYCKAGEACTSAGHCLAELPSEGSVTYEHQRDRLNRDIDILFAAHSDSIGKDPPTATKCPDYGCKKVWQSGGMKNVYPKGILVVAWENRSTLYHSFLDALYILAAPWAMPDPDPYQRFVLDRRIDAELKGLMQKDLNVIALLMQDQVQSLTPYEWDDLWERAKKDEVVEKETQALREIYNSTTDHIKTGAFSRSSDGYSVIYRPGKAIQQLNDIEDHPFWENCSELDACSSK